MTDVCVRLNLAILTDIMKLFPPTIIKMFKTKWRVGGFSRVLPPPVIVATMYGLSCAEKWH